MSYNLNNENALAIYDGDPGNVVITGSGVSTWYDRSNSNDPNKNAVQVTDALRPLHIASDSDFNGHGSLTFSGTQQIITGSFEQPNIATIYAVAKLSATATTTLTYLFSIGSGNNRMILNDHGILSANDGVSNLQMLANTTNSINTIMCATFNTTNSYTYQDNTVFGKTGTLQNYNISGTLIIGTDKTNANSWTGKIACLAIYSGAHSTEQRTRIMKFLSNKYGIAIDQPLAKYSLDQGAFSTLAEQSWTPLSENPLAVYDGDLGITLNGATVSAWNSQDTSGDSARNAVQGTAINQPIYTANDAEFNGHGSLNCTGTQWMLTGTFSSALPASSTIYIIMKPNIITGYGRIIDCISPRYIVSQRAGRIGLYTSGWLETGVGNELDDLAVRIYSTVLNSTSSALYTRSLTALVTGSIAASQPTHFNLFSDDVNHTNSMNGKIAYISVYSGVHDATTRAKIMKYLSAKYNIAVDSSVVAPKNSVTTLLDQSIQKDNMAVAAYTPLADSPLAMYDGDTVVTIGDKVDQWTDLSGRGDINRNARQTTDVNRPSYLAVDPDFNGHGSLQGGVSKYMFTGVFSAAMPQPVTVYSVTKPIADGGTAEIFLDGLAAGAGRIQCYFNTDRSPGVIGNVSTLTGIVPPADQTKHIRCDVFNGVSSAIYLNGAVASSSGNAGSSTATGLALFSNLAGGAPIRGKVAFIAVYAGAHNATTRNRIMRYLSNKYNIAVDNMVFDPSKFSYRNAIQATVGNQPTLILNDTDFNNNNSLTASSTTSNLKTAAFSSTVTQPSTYYLVIKTPTSNPTGAAVFVDGNTVERNMVYVGNTGHITAQCSASLLSTNVISTSSKTVICIIYSAGASTIYINNSYIYEVLGNTGTAAIVAGLTIGGEYTGSINSMATGKITDLQIYSGSHDADTRTSIMESLGAKYGIIVNKPLAVYDGDLGITLNGSNVSGWADQSGQGDSNRNARQDTAINQPLYTLHDSDFNGHGSITGGVGKLLRTGTFSAAIPSTCTVYTVAKSAGINENYIDGIVGQPRLIVACGSTGLYACYAGAWMNTGISIINVPTIGCVAFNSAASIMQSNTLTGSTVNPLSSTLTAMTLLADVAGTSPVVGKVAYIAIYSGVHTTSQRTKILKSLGVKYNIRILARPTVEFDADLGITLNAGTTVSAWLDQSETNDTNKNASQSTAINQPLYTLHDSDFNNHASLTFGGATFLKSGTFTAAIAQPTTIYAVYKLGSGAVIETIIDGLDSTHRNAIINTAAGYASINAGTALSGSVNYKNTKIVHHTYFNGTTSVQYLNNSKMLESTGAAGANSLTGITIGSAYDGSTEFQGKLAYVGIYVGYHNNEIRKMIQNELSVKYGIEIVQG